MSALPQGGLRRGGRGLRPLVRPCWKILVYKILIIYKKLGGGKV